MVFDERFSAPLDSVNLDENSLRFSTFGVDSDNRHISAGVAELKLSDVDLPFRPFNAWLYLQDINKVRHTWMLHSASELESINLLLYVEMERMNHFVQRIEFKELIEFSPQAVDAVGEILLSLSYLPTAERLTVVIAKAKNLLWTNGKTTAGVKLSEMLVLDDTV